MSLFDYEAGQRIEAEGYPFYALIQAAMRQADSQNIARLAVAFPDVHAELVERYNAPGGAIPSDAPETVTA